MGNANEPLYDGLDTGQVIGPDHHQFRLTEQLRSDQFGQVWNAEDMTTSTSVPVTLHIFNPTMLKYQGFIEATKKHVTLSKKIKHKHLAEYYGMFRQKGVLLFIATEVLDGLTLAQLIETGKAKKLTEKQQQGLLMQIAAALDTAHAKVGQPHRALCPEVVYINKGAGVKLSGFAFHEAMEEAADIHDTDPSHLPYKAPEAFHPNPLSTRADVYSLACIAYHLISGKAPFSAADDEAIRIHKELKKPGKLKAPQWEVLQSALATDPMERPATALEFIKALFKSTENDTESADDEENPTPLSEEKKDFSLGKFRIPRGGLISLVFVFGFLLGFALAFYMGSQNTADVANHLSAAELQIENLEEDLGQLEYNLQQENKQHILETEQLQSSLKEQTEKARALHKEVIELKFADPDKLTVFTDQLEDGFKGPQMVIIPRGTFIMGDQQLVGDDNELPTREVTISHRFAISRNEVTFNDYDYYARSMGRDLPNDEGWGRGNRPVINVTWKQANAYVEWLALLTGEPYRLPTEAEWEYVARAGTDTSYWWGEELEAERAVCGECGNEFDGKLTAPVGTFPPNSWGIHDMNGNVDEWVEDCYQDSYFGAPVDGSAMLEGGCEFRVMRGGSWFDIGRVIRSSSRYRHPTESSKNSWGFRVALDLPDNTTEE